MVPKERARGSVPSGASGAGDRTLPRSVAEMRHPDTPVEAGAIKHRREGRSGWKASYHSDLALDRLDRKAGTLAVMVCLDQMGEATLTQLHRAVHFEKGTTNRAVELLSSMGIILRQRKSQFPFSKATRLSEFGSELIRSPLLSWESMFTERRIRGLDSPEQGRRVARRRQDLRP